MCALLTKAILMALLVPCAAPAGAQSGQMSHDSVLLGFHFLHDPADASATGPAVVNVSPSVFDYIEHMPEDLAHVSYADFWHWWREFERYKGDEKGLADMDRVVNACLARGMKVKVDLAWSTWWTNDRDWETESLAPIGPVDVDDWIHLCDLLGRRYRGRIALWLLQGESNNLREYWRGASIEHVHEVFRTGYRAFKRADPGVMISIAGASPSVPRAALDDWVRSHAAACRGYFDDIPMNYFADVLGGDPYGSLSAYYGSVRRILDSAGARSAEIGSGESSFQWALDSYQVKGPPPPWKPGQSATMQPALSEEGQAWRCNRSLGEFFSLGGNKFMFWATEFAPGGGWPWRWGLRKYQDWWGVWPPETKVPGTNIVCRYDNPDGRKVDLSPGWTSSQTDPYHPVWQVYRFWSQATPPSAEAVRLPAAVHASGSDVFSVATYLRSQDRCMALVQSDNRAAAALDIDLARTGWPAGAPLTATVRRETIDYLTGARRTLSEASLPLKASGRRARIDLSEAQGFTTVVLALDRPRLSAECVDRVLVGAPRVGQPIDAVVTLPNTGSETWPAQGTRVALTGSAARGRAWPLPSETAPGATVAVRIQLPAAKAPGHVACILRLRDRTGREFGPTFTVSAVTRDLRTPRKLVAFREKGHVRLKWFAPQEADGVAAYEVQRADGFEQPFAILTRVKATEYVDADLKMDRAYYYRIVALDRKGHRSRPSNEDNARALSRPWTWDAEVVAHTVPARMTLNQPRSVTVTLRNTGLREWRLPPHSGGTRVVLATTQVWGDSQEARLPRVDLPANGIVAPGQEVTLAFPYAPTHTGRFENHWVLKLEPSGREAVYFGTPLLVETVVDAP